jgi:hypothetical protein
MAVEYRCKYGTLAGWRVPNGRGPLGVSEERAEYDVFDHGANGMLVYIRAGTPIRLSTDEVLALIQAFASALQGWL